MENYSKKNKKEKTTIQKILEEYELKQNNFNTNKPSPNVFMKKLHIRMRLYYKEQYKLYNFSTK